jgi:hypothetical protein
MVTPSSSSNDWCRDVSESEKVLSRVESEIETNAPIICQTVEMGENLMREIQSEADYPPGYLVNILFSTFLSFNCFQLLGTYFSEFFF